ncbi:MAG: hypothetical protein Q8Q06_01055 [bacterium]|nr:hypothetical protein [bacterium]
MAGTKIINITKGDSIDEVFNEFQDVVADEVIFILPKRSAFSKKSASFATFKELADAKGQKITVMTGDAIAANLASEAGIEVLENKKNSTAKKPAKIKLSETEVVAEEEPVREITEQEDTGNNEDSAFEELLRGGVARDMEDSMPIAAMASAKYSRPASKKILNDIIPPAIEEEDNKVKVTKERVKEDKIEIKSAEISRDKQTDNIAKMWLARKDVKPLHDIHKKSGKERNIHPFGSGKNFKKIMIPGIVILAVVMITVFYITFGNAKIIITPQGNELNIKFDVTASTKSSSIDYSTDTIPGQQFSDTKKLTSDFKATGQKEVAQKARGKIIIYNTTSAPQIFVATTRFESPAGLIFRIPKSITIPAATGQGPGSIESELFADKAGDEYNIGPARFTIPGLEGSPKFTEFYAQSQESMTGGIIGPSSTVTEQDLTDAQVKLSDQLQKELGDTLRSKAGDLTTAGNIAFDIGEPETNFKLGDATGSFTMSVTGSAKVIAFREDDITKIIEKNKLGNNPMEILPSKTKIDYANTSISEAGDIANFSVSAIVTAISTIDKEAILSDIIGLKESEVRTYFEKFDEIEKAKITLSPFWIREIPVDTAKVEIIIEKE